MNDKFDELAKGLAQSVTRRAALKKFGVGLASIALASLGLERKALANSGGGRPVPNYCLVDQGVQLGYCLGRHSNKYPFFCPEFLSKDCTPGLAAVAITDGDHCYQPHSNVTCK